MCIYTIGMLVKNHKTKVIEKMETSLIIREEKPDWLKIVKLALAKQDWGKVYPLYTSNKDTISCMMKSFDFEDNVATFKVMFASEYDINSWNSYTLVDYPLNHFDVKIFEKKLISAITNYIGTIFRAQAVNEIERRYLSSFDITEETAIKYGYDEEWNEIIKIENEDIVKHALRSLQQEISDKDYRVWDEDVDVDTIKKSIFQRDVGLARIYRELK